MVAVDYAIRAIWQPKFSPLRSVVLFPAYPAASVIVARILLVFTLLDSVVNFCVGCLAYHYIVFLLFGKGLTDTTK